MNNQIETNKDFKDYILREQVHLAIQQIPTMQAASFMVALVLSYVVCDIVPRVNILVWVLTILSITVSRIVLYHQFRKVQSGPFVGEHWENIYLTLSFISGTAWGLSAFIIFPAGDPELTSLKEPLDLSQAARQALPSLTAFLPEKVHLKTDFPLQGPIILGDGAKIRQILTNLVTNAVEAIGDRGGDITLAVGEGAAKEMRELRFFRADWEPKAESYAFLSVSDTGCGLDETTIDNIFDPFFTTRFTGRGLGLPVILGVAKAHEGAITVRSRPGQGATFQVFFPVLHKPYPLADLKAALAGAQKAFPMGKKGADLH